MRRILGLSLSVVSALFALPAHSASGTVDLAPALACTISGTAGNDTLHGSAGTDVICGLAGNDFLVGLGGNDLILGGPGNDNINPGTGNDIVFGEDGDDRLVLDAGSRGYLMGGPGNDYLEANAANPVLLGEAGNDVLVSISPGVFVSATGGTGSDLAVLLDGFTDVFTVGDRPTSQLPLDLGLPCSFAVGQSNGGVEVTCGLISSGIDIDEDGNVSFASGFAVVRTELQLLAASGGAEQDTCYCDIDIPGLPLTGDLIG